MFKKHKKDRTWLHDAKLDRDELELLLREYSKRQFTLKVRNQLQDELTLLQRKITAREYTLAHANVARYLAEEFIEDEMEVGEGYYIPSTQLRSLLACWVQENRSTGKIPCGGIVRRILGALPAMGYPKDKRDLLNRYGLFYEKVTVVLGIRTKYQEVLRSPYPHTPTTGSTNNI